MLAGYLPGQHSTMQIRHSTAWCNTAQDSTARNYAAQHGAAQHRPMQCILTQSVLGVFEQLAHFQASLIRHVCCQLPAV